MRPMQCSFLCSVQFVSIYHFSFVAHNNKYSDERQIYENIWKCHYLRLVIDVPYILYNSSQNVTIELLALQIRIWEVPGSRHGDRISRLRYSWFCQSLQANVGKMSYIKLQPLPPTHFFRINRLIIILQNLIY
jgi:hypothetical protein